ncbi:MAG TPA: type II toxin-antitoxin system RelE/ParE family toxin [bacterium]|nr:type II toxin-antitoxin system RelE/ParE family toxin [bacterium]HOX87579.1 type II toxin-antitoxin system RelE/ParE family toxin [bacterium]HPG47119.1 type II toxin-antitoxin system RelE/ParE family toxin [bacterium]HPM99557.1 type II toxin-antitoxin system RelE/ParE family toxin [bacterium]
MKFKVEFTKRAVKDLKRFSSDRQRQIVMQTIELENNPFPFKNKIKRIQGLKFPCYRLRIDLDSDSFRVFYGIENDIVFILRIIAKKDADKILKALKNIKFPPDIPQ